MAKGKLKDKLFLSQRQQLKHLTKNEYTILKDMCFMSKNIFNVALYNARQYYLNEKKYLNYESNYHLCKDNENYKKLNANMAQQIIKVVDRSFKSFFALIDLAKKGGYQFNQIKLPHYLKKDSYFSLIFSEFNIKNGYFTVPMSPAYKKKHGKIMIKVPSNLEGKKIKEVRIIPKSNNARFFEIQYIYECTETQRDLDQTHSLAVDLGVENLATCVTNKGKSFIVDGRRLKSINQWYNKENSRLQPIKDKQKIKGITKKQFLLTRKRNNQVKDYLNKTARCIIDYCLNNNIGTLIVGYNPTLQRETNIGKANNQNLVNIPIGELRSKLEYLSQMYGINFKEQEESYTSKSDFFANDILPGFDVKAQGSYTFSGIRITRGQYLSSNGKIYNADINGALNIMRKSNLVDVTILQASGVLDMPLRIRIA
ncbi:RNA-guided endonuclease InsQ/TnpB family protein [Clostridium magnum]|uniref:Putative transposase n=1 Tax=Clostridium magnum DSM 2767 TaxID=1121326 RepID=A0A161WQK5_9CLOT|nr:transposase [Clostridium magnum]KZL88928.1 putative transposase [Clostridium magnum DSM 2767]SHI53874.1 transposase, IS605 OrfB family, central region [Clostridium magnum DSM 2767]